MADKVNLTKSLKELEEIADWFDNQEAVDVEEGLTKVKQAAKLIKNSKARLKEIENEFQEIEKEISDGVIEEQ
jgi:exonuclease VII small subunit